MEGCGLLRRVMRSAGALCQSRLDCLVAGLVGLFQILFGGGKPARSKRLLASWYFRACQTWLLTSRVGSI